MLFTKQAAIAVCIVKSVAVLLGYFLNSQSSPIFIALIWWGEQFSVATVQVIVFQVPI